MNEPVYMETLYGDKEKNIFGIQNYWLLVQFNMSLLNSEIPSKPSFIQNF